MKRLNRIMLILAVVVSADLVYPLSVAAQRQTRPTAAMSSADARQRERDRIQAQKMKEKERQQKLKEKAERQKEQLKLKDQQRKEALKAKERAQKEKEKAQKEKAKAQKEKEKQKAQQQKQKAQQQKQTAQKQTTQKQDNKKAQKQDNKKTKTSAQDKQQAKQQAAEAKKRTAEEKKQAAEAKKQAAKEKKNKSDNKADNKNAVSEAVVVSGAAQQAVETETPAAEQTQGEQPQKIVLLDTENETIEYIPGKEINEPLAQEATPAQSNGIMTPHHIIGIGAQSGLASFLPQSTSLNRPAARPANMGFNALGDISYTFLMLNQRQAGVGFRTGVAVGWVRAGQRVFLNETFTMDDPSPVNTYIDYTITSKQVREINTAMLIEVPLMLAFKVQGFYFNVGVKAQLPMLTKYTQTITDPHITAYYRDLGVPVTDNTATGIVSAEDLNKSGDWTTSKFNLLVGGELGYFIPLTQHLALGLGLHGDYCVYTLYSNPGASGQLFNITGVGVTPIAIVNTGTMSENLTTKTGFFDVGAKISLNITF